MRKLSDYFFSQNHEFLKHNLTTAQQNAADFSTLIAQLDSVLYWNYRNMLVATDEPFDAGLSSDFVAFVSNWWDLRVGDFNAIYNASVAAYDPLENYGMTEESATGRSRGELQSSTDTDIKPRVSAQYETTNDDLSPGRLSSYSVAGIQDTNATPKAAGTENSTTKNKYNGTATLTADTLSATANEVETTQHKRHGNIGIQSSQDMLNQEYDVRKRSFIDTFCECFARECLTGLYDTGGDFD